MIIKFEKFIKIYESIFKYNKISEVIFLIGPPAIGKSTWIEDNIDSSWVVISNDDMTEKVAKENNLTYDDMFKDTEFINKLKETVAKRINDKFFKAKKLRKNIIIDRTNMNKKSRKGFLRYFKDDKYYKKKAIVFKFDDIKDDLHKIAKLREDKLREEGNTKKITKEIIDSFIHKFTEPTKEEGFDEIIYVDNTKKLKDILKN